jgi:hypothetical protein
MLCDVTNVLRAGDLVLQFAGGELEVIECKNVDAEALSRRRDPRVTRQINRGQQLARYLTAGELTGRATEIPVPEGHEAVQQAVEINHEPKHDWSLLLDAIEHAAAIGTGLSKKSTEFVLVQRHDAPALTNLDLPRPSNADSTKALLVAFASDIIDNPSPLHPPVTCLPISVEQRLAIWERDLYVCHAIGEDDILGSLPDESSAAITAVEPNGRLHVRVHTEEYILGPKFIQDLLLGFQTVDSMREQALRFALAVSDPDLAPSPSSGVNYRLITPN